MRFVNSMAAFTAAVLSFIGMCVGTASAENKRTVEMTYAFEVTGIPAGAKEVRVWVPYPEGDEEQKILDINVVESPVRHMETTYDKQWGNAMLYFEPNAGLKDFTFKMRFTVERSELKVDLEGNGIKDVDDVLMDKFLKPSMLAIHDRRVERYSNKAVEGREGYIDKARGIYDFILENMEYKKLLPGFGEGDVNKICLAIGEGRKGTGNCTDFHSLFASLMHMQGMPVIFEMGFPLKPGKSQKEPIKGGYHCWAKFYVPGKGWVPVDISEADKDPSRKDYFFGAICENRVRFSRGRDIMLNPPQKGEPLNFFGPDPYIEVDGVPFTGFERTITYK